MMAFESNEMQSDGRIQVNHIKHQAAQCLLKIARKKAHTESCEKRNTECQK